MFRFPSLVVFLCLLVVGAVDADGIASRACRNQPGSPGFPTAANWASLNSTVGGKVVNVVPFVQFCRTRAGGCTLQQFASATFRNEVLGAMNYVNFEQDYDANPPSLCQPASLVCGQGNVPLFGLFAESVSDVQAALKFAQTFKLRLAVKASGHDFLGRSTAKNSLLISTHKLQNVTFTDNFVVGGKNLGSAVTLGSGVPLNTMYRLTKAQGKFAVGGTAATVVPAGGYFQGGGHSAVSPLLGLAADNTLEINVVTAAGQFVKANSIQNSDLFWAMRGGGAGSWGVVISATFKTHPTFDSAVSLMNVSTTTASAMAQVAAVHAKHIFDWDQFRAGQYFYLSTNNLGWSTNASTLTETPQFTGIMNIETFFPNLSADQATAALKPFMDDLRSIEGITLSHLAVQANINDALFNADDLSGPNLVLGSRLIPASTYKKSPELVGQVYSELLNGGATNILGNLVAGGQVSANANISSAVNPAWRTAKVHLIMANNWADNATIPQVLANQTVFKTTQLPIIQKLSGLNAGAYSNEADTLEAKFQTTFFGPNYAKLSLIKSKYDPTDLFIVRAGVGSERWDADGLCRV